MQSASIPADRRARNPLITEAGYARLRALLEDPDAPAWNYVVGDRVQRRDLADVEATRKAVRAARRAGTGAPPTRMVEWVRALRPHVGLFRRALPEGFDLVRDWRHIPTMTREDLVLRMAEVVLDDADLARLIVYDTSGTTGHAIHVPHHPRAMAQNHAFLEFVLERHGVRLDFDPGCVACINVGAQASTVTFATVFSVWKNAGFAKVNLHGRAWSPEQAQAFFARHAPLFLTGDPMGFAELMRWGVQVRPAALVSTAVHLRAELTQRLREEYACPVIDTYAATETGPIAYAGPEDEGMHVLPHDIYVEIVDAGGAPLPEGVRGEICVTGGRNPYVPLLRYRTGDFGRLVWSDAGSDDVTPRILDLEARQPVCFRAADGTVVCPVDIGRILREWVFVQHEFVQRRDGSCTLVIAPAPGCPLDTDALSSRLEKLLGYSVAVTLDPGLAASRPCGKVVPFRSELA